jgi:Uncharacterized protein conserved in cyanobacteria
MSATAVPAPATVEDLYGVPDNVKAELVDGELHYMSPTGFWPGRASGRIYRSLTEYEESVGGGFALPDNVGFVVNLLRRRSFSPDAAFFTGQPSGMRYLQGAPAFAAEVRSLGDYDEAANRDIVAKRRDYFAAGTLVVWDVDLLAGEVRKFTAEGGAEAPAAVFRRGDVADAEPAVPGWRLPTDELLPPAAPESEGA